MFDIGWYNNTWLQAQSAWQKYDPEIDIEVTVEEIEGTEELFIIGADNLRILLFISET